MVRDANRKYSVKLYISFWSMDSKHTYAPSSSSFQPCDSEVTVPFTSQSFKRAGAGKSPSSNCFNQWGVCLEDCIYHHLEMIFHPSLCCCSFFLIMSHAACWSPIHLSSGKMRLDLSLVSVQIGTELPFFPGIPKRKYQLVYISILFFLYLLLVWKLFPIFCFIAVVFFLTLTQSPPHYGNENWPSVDFFG